MRALASRLLAILLIGSLAAWPVAKKSKKKKSPHAAAVKRPRKKIKGTWRQRVPKPPPVSEAARSRAAESVTTGLDLPLDRSLYNPAALIPFYEMLYRLERQELTGPVRVLHYGDSHTAADDWTGTIRSLLQARFGDGGPGFTLAGHPFPGFRRLDAKGWESGRWTTDGLVGHKSDGFNGLGGVSISTSRAGESVSLEAGCRLLELYYLQQPDGGELELSDAGTPLGSIPTAGDTVAPAYYHAELPAGEHRLSLRTTSRGEVRLFGWVAENESGITYESMGINGAQASIVLNWDEALLAAHVARRNPALIVLAYGTNEASNSAYNYESYYQMYSEVIRRFRAAAPAATILAVGPPDRYRRVRGKWQLFDSTEWIIRAQRDAALANGCAFWDMRAKMGGKGSLQQWVTAGLAQYDHVHLTSAGYRRLGEVMVRDLLENYGTFVQERTKTGAENSHGEKSENH